LFLLIFNSSLSTNIDVSVGWWRGASISNFCCVFQYIVH